MSQSEVGVMIWLALAAVFSFVQWHCAAKMVRKLQGIVEGLVERMAKQSYLLSRAAEKQPRCPRCGEDSSCETSRRTFD